MEEELVMSTASADKSLGRHIQRTMRLLASSKEDRQIPVKILFYGQSIVRQDYVRNMVEKERDMQ